jgi:hypothetical protein
MNQFRLLQFTVHVPTPDLLLYRGETIAAANNIKLLERPNT